MNFHVINLPHTQTTADYSSCAYSQKVIRFCAMMRSLGHSVYLYGSAENEAPCTEFVSCLEKIGRPEQYLDFAFDPGLDHWQRFNASVIREMGKRIKPRDFICVIAGACQKPIADAFPNNFTVEFGIGYGGVFSNFRVFESQAWKNAIYGQTYGACNADEHFYDAVIPNYYNTGEFPFSKERDDYYLYIGRLTDRKGYRIAAEVCQRLGRRLILAGHGKNESGYGEHVGMVGVEERGRLMSRARAVFVPTIYLAPHEGVSVESQLCGTPVIVSPSGGLVENVEHGKTGFICHTLREFVEAAENVGRLDREYIRKRAQNKWDMRLIKYRYEEYFQRLYTLHYDGFYEMTDPAELVSREDDPVIKRVSHLGGSVPEGDLWTWAPEVWDYLIKTLDIKSVIDIGCGAGYTLQWFANQGLDVLGVDGDPEAVKLASEKVSGHVFEHDFTVGRLPLVRDYDFGWCCEFVEHVEKKYMENYLRAFDHCKVLAMTFAEPGQQGYHHVNCVPEKEWIDTMESRGFTFERMSSMLLRAMMPKDHGQHIKRSLLIFRRNDVCCS